MSLLVKHYYSPVTDSGSGQQDTTHTCVQTTKSYTTSTRSQVQSRWITNLLHPLICLDIFCFVLGCVSLC